jgi:uncharacterized membrane protein
MNILHRRKLIQDVPPDVVWGHISNIAQNPTWQVDCRSVSFLSTRRTGPGVRWRYTNDQGRECVVETTAWYEGLGYEYTFIDGAPFRTSRGRIRLQEIPEGTVVQWSLNYETTGVLGGVRNTITLKRHLDSVMGDSLETLWRFVHQSSAGRTVHEPKSLMRDAPDYEARAKYQPRHPSVVQIEQNTGAVIPEPPISDEDTRPRAPVASAEPAASDEQAFYADVSMFEPPRERAGTETQPATTPVEVPEEETATAEEAPAATNDDFFQPVAESVTEQPAVVSPEELAKMDTSQISVFDVFGLPKPSETQEMKAVSMPARGAATTTQSAMLRAEATTVELPYVSGGRVGRRIRARRTLVKLRRP